MHSVSITELVAVLGIQSVDGWMDGWMKWVAEWMGEGWMGRGWMDRWMDG